MRDFYRQSKMISQKKKKFPLADKGGDTKLDNRSASLFYITYYPLLRVVTKITIKNNFIKKFQEFKVVSLSF